MKTKLFTLSNNLSYLRILLSIPIAYAIINEHNICAVILCFVASFTDMGDGYFARKLKQTSDYGRALDPIADKIFVASIIIALLVADKIPIWFLAVVIGRDLLILAASPFFAKKIQKIIPSDFVGKATVTILGFTIILIILDYDIYYSRIAMYFSSAAIAYSLVHYALRAKKIINENRKMGLIE